MDPYILDPAGTPYNDWVGTAAAEKSLQSAASDLRRFAGLDNGWSILAIDLETSSRSEPPRWDVRIYAYDRGEYGPLHDAAELRDSVPVRNILLHDVSLDDVVRSMQHVHFQLLKPNLPKLKVIEVADHPPRD